jgi:hypothetical protein
MTKDELRGASRFHNVDPDELEGINEWSEYLDAILHGPCSVWEEDGELFLIETKQLVDRINGLKLEIYPNEHPPPHFHAKSATINASFNIENCDLLHGKVSSKDHEKIRFWHQKCKPILIEVWNITRPTVCKVGPYRE